MRIAIYSRKSKLTETGDSIQNQIAMCKSYAENHFKDCEFIIYEDEGFSGGNTDRPNFQKLIRDIKDKKIDALICYRLDRISRNVADFSETLELLIKYDVAFVSIKEQFDTSTPMGRAMIYIASVFAQLERDTIAERITDNCTELAKTGRLIVGCVPEGFRIKKTELENGKTYKSLELVLDECEKIKLIFDKYIELQSITKLKLYCIENNILTKRGFKINSDWLYRALSHPYYTVADVKTYNYFYNLGCIISSQKHCFNGEYGIIAYRRSKNKSHTNNQNNWIISVGEHSGIIPSQKWIDVQNILNSKNKYGEKTRTTTGHYGLFTGMLKCGNCGSFMRPMSIRNGRFYYKCVLKDSSRKKNCDIKDIRGDVFDDLVLTEIINILDDTNIFLAMIKKQIKAKTQTIDDDNNKILTLSKSIKAKKDAIKKLLIKLSTNDSNIVDNYINEEIELLHTEIKSIELQLENIKNSTINNNPLGLSQSYIDDYTNNILEDCFIQINDTAIKRNMLKTIINDLIWDGEDVSINLSKV